MSRPELSRAPLSGDAPYFAVELEPRDGSLWLLEQRALPERVHYLKLTTAAEVATAIADMTVRGAPAIGITAAYGMAMAAGAERGDAAAFLKAQGAVGRMLEATRPTAVNLAWAIARMARKAAEVAKLGAEARSSAMQAEAEAIHREDVAACHAMGELGAKDVPDGATVMTHCNAGALATGGWGTALGVIRSAAAQGKLKRVLACETRPYLQGARLTAWELHRDGIEVEVITDSMSAHFMSKDAIQFVVVGADRIAKNGDVANKIGTYGHAVLAHAHQIPFTVAAPFSTFDLRTAQGSDIVIEERSRDEVARIGDTMLVADGIGCRHPAFDVTPARYVRAIYSERGVVRPSEGHTLEHLAGPR